MQFLSRIRSEARMMQKDAEEYASHFKGELLESGQPQWKGVMSGPCETPYAGGKFQVEPPVVVFHTRIHHPNISKEGRVSLSFLREGWCPVTTIIMTLFGVWHALLDPEIGDCGFLSYAADQYKNNYLKFFATAEAVTIKYARPERGLCANGMEKLVLAERRKVKENAAARKENAALRAQLSESETKKRKIEDEAEEEARKAQRKESENTDQKAQIDQLQNDLAALREKNERERTALETQVSRVEGENSELSRHNKEREREIEERKKTEGALAAAFEVMRAQILQQQIQIDKQQTQITDQESVINQRKTENEHLQAEKDRYLCILNGVASAINPIRA